MKIFLVFLSLFFYSINAQAVVEIKLCYEDVSVFPWITGNESGLVFIELSQIEKELPIKFKYIRLPWKRCQFEGQSGNVDGLIAASFTEERSTWGVYPTNANGELNSEYRFHTDSFYVYVRKDSNINFKDGKFINLGANPIGVQLGYSVGNDLTKQGLPIHSSFSTAYDLIKELDYSAIEVAVLQNHESNKVLNEKPKFKKNIKRLHPPFKTAHQYLLFTKPFFEKNKKISGDIWKAMPRARKSQAYVKLEKSLLNKH